ncbi:MAG: GNAT family N-acetyltransferase [Anaerolineales bacterium]|nr:GNAT family N-acetyltransferase [Anaerolineales bacterium]
MISTDPALLDLEAICSFLSRAYWAQNRPREIIERSLPNSLCFGIYDGKKQVGFARLVTDYVTFAWLCDVFIDDEYRGQGLGKWLMSAIVSHPDLINIRRILLVTRDAHGLYRQYGFTALANLESWMERFQG